MKAKFYSWISALVGKLDGLVYYNDQVSGEVLVREYVVPVRSSSNDRLGSNSLNLREFYNQCNEDFRRDLTIYATMQNMKVLQTGHRLNSYTMLTKLMYALKKAYPVLDLSTITPAEAVAQGYPIDTVCNAIDAGLIEPVNGYRNLNRNILER